MTADELSTILQREKRKLTRFYLSPMIEKTLLIYKYPEMPKHPYQTYRSNKPKKEELKIYDSPNIET
jgi:hypothetical protein